MQPTRPDQEAECRFGTQIIRLTAHTQRPRELCHAAVLWRRVSARLANHAGAYQYTPPGYQHQLLWLCW